MRSVFSIVTPLPGTVSRETAVAMLHDHAKMIELNPLVIDHKPARPPKEAPPDEFHCIWYEVTDKMSWLPGVKGTLKFHVCFNDLPLGVQTHVYAPMGLDIQEKWSIGGNLPGEPREPRELGITVPRDVLYLREDVNMNVNRIFTSFTKTKLNKAHGTLVERLLLKGEIIEDVNYQTAISDTMSQSDGSSTHNQMPHGLASPPLGSPALGSPGFGPPGLVSPGLGNVPYGQRLSTNSYRVSGMGGIDQKGMTSPPIHGYPVEGGHHHKSASIGKTYPAELPDNPMPPSELYSPSYPPQGGMSHGRTLSAEYTKDRLQ